MDLGLVGKVALVAGGSHGIGAATAKILAAEGACLSICGRSPEALQDAQAEIEKQFGSPVLTVQADFSSPTDIEQFIAKSADHFGGIDILVNSVGSSTFGTFAQVPDEAWIQDLNLKLLGTVRACRAVLPHLRCRGGGRIVNVAGNSGKQPYSWHFPGGAANAGLLNFTHALAQEVCPDNILVNAVCPGPVLTRRLRGQIDVTPELQGLPFEVAEKRFSENLPLGRVATPEEIAYLIAFLVSNKAGYISGTSITIDGCISKGI